MARDLRAGDVVRILGQTSRGLATADGPEIPVFNPSVAKSQSYFVGDHDALVHDNSLLDPHARRFVAIPR